MEVSMSHGFYRAWMFGRFGGQKGGGTPWKRLGMDWHWPSRELGRFVGGFQQHCAAIDTRVGMCIEEGKARLLKHISKIETYPVLANTERSLDSGRAAHSLLTDFLSLQSHVLQMGEERRDKFLQLLSRLHGHQRLSGRPLFASLSSSSHDISSQLDPKPLFQLAMTTEQVSKRLDGVPVYTVSNSANEFILISDMSSQKSLGIFCFRQADAESLLSQVRDREPSLGRGAKVVAVSLDKVYQLNTEGIAFRFLPDPRQVKNALEAKGKSGDPRKAFDGVPVFQSDNLILRSNNRRFCPIFFCKEDLERALSRAFKQQQRVNPSLKVNSDIQVGSFEDVLKRMENNDENSGWGDIVFIPPGIDAFSHLGKAFGQGSQRESVIA